MITLNYNKMKENGPFSHQTLNIYSINPQFNIIIFAQSPHHKYCCSIHTHVSAYNYYA